MFGRLSLLLRRRRTRKESRKTIRTYETWRQELETLPPPCPQTKKILIIRLDDIGDYILFRNCLDSYRHYYVEKGCNLYLLGNEAWKPIFNLYDANGIQALWLDKKRYWQDAAYRQLTWEQLRREGFETVICPSRTRPLLLDDLCMLACAPMQSFGVANTHKHTEWNIVSDKLYTAISDLSLLPDHEFTFNTNFACFICPFPQAGTPQLHIKAKGLPSQQKPYIICFIGASAKSKLWPAMRWIKLINLLKDSFQGTIFIAGGPSERDFAEEIAMATGSANIAGNQTLTEITDLIACAQVIISNDTMAAHIGAAAGTNTIIITTGNNGYRFTDYRKISKDNVTTIYSPRYKKLLKKNSPELLYSFQGVTSDIAAIDEREVLNAIGRSIEPGYKP